MVEIKHETWQSTAGYLQERWVVMRGDIELGSIQRFNKYQAMLNYNTRGEGNDTKKKALSCLRSDNTHTWCGLLLKMQA